MAKFNFNKVTLGGRLTADPALKTTPSGVSVTTFTIAINRRFSGKNGEETQTDFINVTAWRQTAEFITRFFHRGSAICVVGSIQTRSCTDQHGQKRFATEVVADEAYFVDAKADTRMPGAGDGARAANAPQMPKPDPGVYSSAPGTQFEKIGDDEDLPF